MKVFSLIATLVALVLLAAPAQACRRGGGLFSRHATASSCAPAQTATAFAPTTAVAAPTVTYAAPAQSSCPNGQCEASSAPTQRFFGRGR